METTRKFAPEAVSGLRRFLNAVPFSVRSVVLQFNWQRSGCIGCHRPDHSIYDCPHLPRERSEDMAREVCQMWCGLIGEELLLLAASSSSDNYIAASEARARPAFHFRGPSKKTSGAYQQQPAFAHATTASADPKQHLQKENAATTAKPPAAIAKPKSAAKAKAHAQELSVGHPQRRQDASDAKPKAPSARSI